MTSRASAIDASRCACNSDTASSSAGTRPRRRALTTEDGIRFALPIMHGSIELTVHRQVGSLIRELPSQLLVNLDSQSRLFPGMHPSILEVVGVRENLVGFRSVSHVLLDAEVLHAQIEMQCRRHAHRTQIR